MTDTPRLLFVGAGPGAADLITVRGQNALQAADVVVYAGSLVNPALLENCKPGCEIYNSAPMTLEEITDVLIRAVNAGKSVVRLHTGDPSLYGAIREQMDILDQHAIDYAVVPGVSSFLGAAAALKAELTLPSVSQTVILTRMEGRTKVPTKENMAGLARHGASMVIFLSMSLLKVLTEELLRGGYTKDTPAAIVYKATWPDEKTIHTTVGELVDAAESHAITKTALVLVGGFLGDGYAKSKLYDADFSHGFRKADTP